MTATVEADVVITAAPETRKGRRAGDPPGTETEFAYAVARLDDGTRVELWSLTETAKAAIRKLGKGDSASVRGELAAKSVAGCAVLQVNIQTVSMRLPTEKPKAAKGMMMATRSGVEAADRDWRERTAANQ